MKNKDWIYYARQAKFLNSKGEWIGTKMIPLDVKDPYQYALSVDFNRRDEVSRILIK